MEAAPSVATNALLRLVGSIGSLTPRSTLVGQDGSQAPPGPDSLPIRETRIVAQALLAISDAPPACTVHWTRQASVPFSPYRPPKIHKKRPDISDRLVPGDKTGCTGGVYRARTYDLHDVNVAL